MSATSGDHRPPGSVVSPFRPSRCEPSVWRHVRRPAGFVGEGPIFSGAFAVVTGVRRIVTGRARAGERIGDSDAVGERLVVEPPQRRDHDGLRVEKLLAACDGTLADSIVRRLARGTHALKSVNVPDRTPRRSVQPTGSLMPVKNGCFEARRGLRILRRVQGAVRRSRAEP